MFSVFFLFFFLLLLLFCFCTYHRPHHTTQEECFINKERGKLAVSVVTIISFYKTEDKKIIIIIVLPPPPPPFLICILLLHYMYHHIYYSLNKKHYFKPVSFQPVLHDWCNKSCGMCYPVYGMVHRKEPLLLIEKSGPCGGSGFPLSLSEWSFTIITSDTI